jgi:hypothetical protein
LQKELVAVVDTTHYLYYVDVPNLILGDLKMVASLSNKVMENVQKEHMTHSIKGFMFVTSHLVLNFSNKYRFIIT